MDKEEILAKLWASFTKLQLKEMSKAFDEMGIDLPRFARGNLSENEKTLSKYVYFQGLNKGFESAIEAVEEYLNREKRAFIVSLKDGSESEVVFAESEMQAKDICEFHTQDGVEVYKLKCERAERYDELENQQEKILLEKWASEWD